jgi:hypothetical protein
MRKVLAAALAGVLTITGVAALTQTRGGFDQDLLAQATLSPEQARQKALALAPGGSIIEEEIEEENGRLIYSFELKVPGQERATEVEIDAKTGEILPPDQDDEEDDDGDDDDDDDDDRGKRK